jgi:NitT/TauT family transport system substrate-binding protein
VNRIISTSIMAVLLGGTCPADAADAPVWRHAIIEAKSDAGLFMTVTRGFAEKQGLKLELSQVKTDAIGLKALIAGELDSYDGTIGGTVMAGARGADVKLIGCHWQGLPHGIFTKASVQSITELKGKTFAISTPSSLPDLLAKAALKKFNISPDEVKFANLGADLDRYKALAAGVVEATVVSGEYAPIATTQGLKLMLPGREVLPNYMRLCYFSTARSLGAHREEAVRFMAAEMNAWHYALTHRAETIALTREITGAKADDPRPEYIYDDTVKTHAVDPELSLPMEKIQWMADQLVTEGGLTRPFDMTKMIDPSIREAALARLTPGAKNQ